MVDVDSTLLSMSMMYAGNVSVLVLGGEQKRVIPYTRLDIQSVCATMRLSKLRGVILCLHTQWSALSVSTSSPNFFV